MIGMIFKSDMKYAILSGARMMENSLLHASLYRVLRGNCRVRCTLKVNMVNGARGTPLFGDTLFFSARALFITTRDGAGTASETRKRRENVKEESAVGVSRRSGTSSGISESTSSCGCYYLSACIKCLRPRAPLRDSRPQDRLCIILLCYSFADDTIVRSRLGAMADTMICTYWLINQRCVAQHTAFAIRCRYPSES